MPQCKIHFRGAQGLDTAMPMPPLLQNKMHEREWMQFVADMNFSIRQAQSSMNWSPWFILGIVSVCILLVVIDIALDGVFGTPTAGVITMSLFVFCGVVAVCHATYVKPSRTCEEMVELICEDYSDDQRQIYFFYRHHAHVRITENRFYIEVFVPHEHDHNTALALDVIPEQEQQLVPWEPPEETSTALQVVPLQPPPQSSSALVPFDSSGEFFDDKQLQLESQALVPLTVERVQQALVALNHPPSSSQAVVANNASRINNTDVDRYFPKNTPRGQPSQPTLDMVPLYPSSQAVVSSNAFPNSTEVDRYFPRNTPPGQPPLQRALAPAPSPMPWAMMTPAPMPHGALVPLAQSSWVMAPAPMPLGGTPWAMAPAPAPMTLAPPFAMSTAPIMPRGPALVPPPFPLSSPSYSLPMVVMMTPQTQQDDDKDEPGPRRRQDSHGNQS
jgi:hypothetical protein